MAMTDATARNAAWEGKDYRISDTNGLCLKISKVSKRWFYRYLFGGKEKLLAIGHYPATSLKDARAARDRARALLDEGIDPVAAKLEAKAAAKAVEENSLEAVAREWFATQSPRWKPDHAAGVMRSIEKDLFPALGRVRVETITAQQALEFLRSVEARGALETASRLQQRLSAILRFAVTTGRIPFNPCADLRGALTATKPRHHHALPAAELPEFFRRLNAEPLDRLTVLGFRLLLLTMARPGEVRHAEWSEIDTEGQLWRIPSRKMKMARDHIVPLSRQALAVLDELRTLTGHQRYLLPNRNDSSKVMSENTFSRAMRRMGYTDEAVPHGFRAVASTLLNEASFSSDWIELSLAHVERNQVRASYNRAEHLDGRRKMLQWLADYYEMAETGTNVIPFNFRPSATY